MIMRIVDCEFIVVKSQILA